MQVQCKWEIASQSFRYSLNSELNEALDLYTKIK